MKRKRKLKLFVWENVLSDYSSGIMFALAVNETEARSAIREKHLNLFGYYSDQVENGLREEPKVITKAEGFLLWGGG